MRYKVVLSNNARKGLRKIKGKDGRRIIIALKALENNPYLGEKMKGKYEDSYRLRVWPYRIVYSVENNKLMVFVIAIGAREGIYG